MTPDEKRLRKELKCGEQAPYAELKTRFERRFKDLQVELDDSPPALRPGAQLEIDELKKRFEAIPVGGTTPPITSSPPTSPTPPTAPSPPAPPIPPSPRAPSSQPAPPTPTSPPLSPSPPELILVLEYLEGDQQARFTTKLPPQQPVVIASQAAGRFRSTPDRIEVPASADFAENVRVELIANPGGPAFVRCLESSRAIWINRSRINPGDRAQMGVGDRLFLPTDKKMVFRLEIFTG